LPVCVGVPERDARAESERPQAANRWQRERGRADGAALRGSLTERRAGRAAVSPRIRERRRFWQTMVSVYPVVPVQPFASVTLTVIEKVPVWVGVPDSPPFVASEDPKGAHRWRV